MNKRGNQANKNKKTQWKQKQRQEKSKTETNERERRVKHPEKKQGNIKESKTRKQVSKSALRTKRTE